jgi:hypothetical protein
MVDGVEGAELYTKSEVDALVAAANSGRIAIGALFLNASFQGGFSGGTATIDAHDGTVAMPLMPADTAWIQDNNGGLLSYVDRVGSWISTKMNCATYAVCDGMTLYVVHGGRFAPDSRHHRSFGFKAVGTAAGMDVYGVVISNAGVETLTAGPIHQACCNCLLPSFSAVVRASDQVDFYAEGSFAASLTATLPTEWSGPHYTVYAINNSASSQTARVGLLTVGEPF